MRHQTTIAVYVFLWNYHQEHGFSPTQQEIAEACFMARSGVLRHLDKLTIWGWISRAEGKARGIRPLKPINEIEKQLPLTGF
jgi:SOS-response transcriptional repressor LexA